MSSSKELRVWTEIVDLEFEDLKDDKTVLIPYLGDDFSSSSDEELIIENKKLIRRTLINIDSFTKS